MANDQMAIGQLAKDQMAIGQMAKDKRPNGKWPNGKCQNGNGIPKFLKVPKVATSWSVIKNIFRK